MRPLRFLLPTFYFLLCAVLHGADSSGRDFQVVDSATNDKVLYKLHDNGDGTKSLVVYTGTVTVTGGLTDTQLRATAVPVSGTFFQATQPVSLASLPALPAGSNVIGHVIVDSGPELTDTQLRAAAVPTSDAGASWTTVRGVSGARFTSADQSAAVASVTDSPTSTKKLVITDLIISVDTAMRVDFTEESSATIIESIYMAANSTVNVVTRSKRKLATADKKLQVKTSVAGNISVNAFYYSE